MPANVQNSVGKPLSRAARKVINQTKYALEKAEAKAKRLQSEIDEKPSVTPEDRLKRLICTAVATGIKPELIALDMGLTLDELRTRFATQLEHGKELAGWQTAHALYTEALDGSGAPRITAATNWLRMRHGWKEAREDFSNAPTIVLNIMGGRDGSIVIQQANEPDVLKTLPQPLPQVVDIVEPSGTR